MKIGKEGRRNGVVVAALAIVVALPFIFKREAATVAWKRGDPVVVVIAPHNEAIRYEFGRAFSAWHHERYGVPAKVDWRVIGGTSEIMRYLAAKYTASFKAWWKQQGETWPAGGGSMILDRKFKPSRTPAADDAQAVRLHGVKTRLHAAFRTHDDGAAFGCKVDVFFGGGTYDHYKAGGQGMCVPAWSSVPTGIFETASGDVLIPSGLSGEYWRGKTYYGACVSTFGLCYNEDRLADRGITNAPVRWSDLADPRYVGQIGVADPTKSGSITKAFEMIVHEQIGREVADAGFSKEQETAFEKAISKAKLPLGALPDGVPVAYQAAVEAGWLRGIRLVQRIGANARYFTDGAGKVPVDVSMGNAMAGLCIDFYGRFQAEQTRSPEGKARMHYVTPHGGSSVSADPISMLRGAANRETAVRFIEFVLSAEGQKLWCHRPGSPGGPERYALRRLPIRRDFYPAGDDGVASAYDAYREHYVDALGDPHVNPYELANDFTYRMRWTGRLFNPHRKLIRAMCLDSGQELRSAWKAIIASGGPGACPEAMHQLETMPDVPVPLNWASADSILESDEYDELELMRVWTQFFRDSYRKAEALARGAK